MTESSTEDVAGSNAPRVGIEGRRHQQWARGDRGTNAW